MVFIYILKLRRDKYYIGKSKAKTLKGVKTRIQKHFDGKGAVWTKLYTPLEIIEIKEDQNVLDEDKWTKFYMMKYGISNVRGGSYVRTSLTIEQIHLLLAEFDAASDKCYKCKEKGHIGQYCPNKYIINEYICDLCNTEYNTKDDIIKCKKKDYKILYNILQRFKNIKYKKIEKLCKKYKYHGGLVSQELRIM